MSGHGNKPARGPGRPPRWRQWERDFLLTLSEGQRSWLAQQAGHPPAELPDLVDTSRRDLLRLFPGRPSPNPDGPSRPTLNDRQVILVLAWQLAMKIRSRTRGPLEGNMRTAWYNYVEPFYLDKDLLDSDLGQPLDVLTVLLSENVLGALERSESELRMLALPGLDLLQTLGWLGRAAREKYITDTMTEAFDDLFLQGILDFEEDFGFDDPGEARYQIGENKAGKLLATEKLGLRRLAQKMGRLHRISWFVSHGEPSLLALYFMAKKLRLRVQSVEVGAVTDYDPFGYSIASSVQLKLQAAPLFGAGKVELVRLTGSQAMIRRLFTPEELERAKRDLKRYHRVKRKQIENWMKQTGGIGGEEYGLHIDLANRTKMEALITDWIGGRLGS
jgi:hypothetical protein